MKVSELEGKELDRAVAIAQGWVLKHTMDWAPNVDEWGRDIQGAEPHKIESGWAKWHKNKRVVSLLGYGDIKECDWKPSSDWGLGGPIIEREHIGVAWRVSCWVAENVTLSSGPKRAFADGPTPLIAAMRCFVASKFGDEVSE